MILLLKQVILTKKYRAGLLITAGTALFFIALFLIYPALRNNANFSNMQSTIQMNSNDVNSVNGNSSKGYVGISLFDENDNMLRERSIPIESGGKLSVKLKISNSIPEDREYLIKILCEDKFVSFIVDGQLGEEHYVYTGKDSDKVVSMSFADALSDGKHDFVMLLIAYPSNSGLSELERHDGRIYKSRFNIIVGNDNQKAVEDNIETAEYVNDSYKTNLGFYVSDVYINNRAEGVKLLTEIKYNPKIKLYINIPNSADQQMVYKLVCLKNWEVYKVLNREYLLFGLEKGKSVTIPVDIELSKNDIGKELVFMLIPQPFESMSSENLQMLGRSHISIDVENSTRFLIK